ncbi:MAG: hypothetical protein KC646_01615 [Candidatus Cloacimonetes bacterium]|nr:hypothetical protein [Candidatus Cloacimonadota bacterium]
MIKILLFILSTSISMASGSHIHTNIVQNKVPQIYNQYKLKNKVKKPASAVYLCTCGDQVWKQDAGKIKACPYCGPAMPNCGLLVKVLPKRGEKYDWSDYDLPNKICPISNEEIKNSKHQVKLDDKAIFVCCKKCVTKFKRAITKGKAHKKLRKLPLKPEKFGFILKTPSEHQH